MLRYISFLHTWVFFYPVFSVKCYFFLYNMRYSLAFEKEAGLFGKKVEMKIHSRIKGEMETCNKGGFMYLFLSGLVSKVVLCTCFS